MIGLIKPSSGTAYVLGLNIKDDMDKIYPSMGVCPQHVLLWEASTNRKGLFYGRLKNLKGFALTQDVEESLKCVTISLIGDPKVVYMDEPSPGLDLASRNMPWNVVKRAKQNRAIILTMLYLCSNGQTDSKIKARESF